MSVRALAEIKTLGDGASKAIEQFFRKILQHEAEVLKDEDPEELHQMRVGMRRLRSAVAGFAPAVKLPKQVNDKNIGKFSRCLGKLRDLDVLSEALENDYKPILPPEEKATLEKALAKIKKQRRRAFKEVRSLLKNSKYSKFKQALEVWLERPKYRAIASWQIVDVIPDILLPQISQLFLHPGWLVKAEHNRLESNNGSDSGLPTNNEDSSYLTFQPEEEEKLHDLRKEVKRVRYLMSLFTDFYGQTYDVYLEDMKAIQEHLGELQDSVVLEEFMEDIYGKKISALLPNLLDELDRNRSQSWRKWQLLQRRYCNPAIRHNFRSEILNGCD
ncbi:MAG: CHAD domain-containing protein [Cyanobacteriota bacterium]|nr:CHAD domain-containing protein [Cyanobacteriota bacterium]